MTECLGVDTSFYDTITFAYGCALTGAAGGLLAPLKSITPTMGTSYLLDSFMTVCVGGADSFLGTVVASFGIGEATALIGGYSSTVAAKLLVFIVIIVLIRFRPEGIFVKEKR
jgi:urea transport system permease protein